MSAKIINRIKGLMVPYRFGFVQGHSYLGDEQLEQIKRAMHSDIVHEKEIISAYEREMVNLIGPGYGISYASGRMAFYSILKALNIGPGDEVVLLGFTCSVMPNAVWRTGAIPVYSDVDEETFGSSAELIEKKLTKRTKVIVAQHSFGIPCKIKEIVELGRQKDIFIIEDCAITFDSLINGIKVGNWGDAAIFSTDHSKPINTILGGFSYTNNSELYNNLKKYSENLLTLDKGHQLRLFNQILFERKYYTPDRYTQIAFSNFIRKLISKVSFKKKPIFLEEDCVKPTNNNSFTSYPYPAKFPSLLAQLGLFEIDRWGKVKKRRKNVLQRLLDSAENSMIKEYIPKIYYDPSVDLSPLRFIYSHPDSTNHLKQISRYLDIDGIWFRTPVIGCTNGLQDIGYSPSSCKTSEQVGLNIINWPCNVNEKWENIFCDLFKNVVSG